MREAALGMLAIVHSSTLLGIEAHPVVVEAHIGKGLPGFDLVGLAETAVRESRVRVRAALSTCDYELPPRHIVLSLAPADVRKTGSAFDLAIAIALLAAAGFDIQTSLDETLLIGELSLTGELRPVRGVLSHLRAAQKRGVKRAIIPIQQAAAGAWFDGIDVRVARHLRDVIDHLHGETPLLAARELSAHTSVATADQALDDMADVIGQESAKRALEIAAVGDHNVLMTGPPGAGKSMLARRLIGILPPPQPDEALEIATVASAAGFELDPRLLGGRPFRSPHHSASDVAVVGGGDPVRPGEVTLAHGGVLFLDELPEFRRPVVEALRTTMEDGVASISRVRQRVTMPARPIVIAAMNPCPCGYAGAGTRECHCSVERVRVYRHRISGPILDRFDIHLTLSPLKAHELGDAHAGEPSARIRERVCEARQFAYARKTQAAQEHTHTIAGLTISLEQDARKRAEKAVDQLRLSARAYAKVLRVSRSIADLDAAPLVQTRHLAEALTFRGTSPERSRDPLELSHPKS